MQSINSQLLVFANEYLQNILITEEFCRYRDILVSKFADRNRSPKQKSMDADCLIAEYTLINAGVVQAPPEDIMNYDFRLGKHLVDAKVVHKKWFSVMDPSWFERGINEKKLTDFAFYSFVKKPTEVLEPGDTVSLRFIKAIGAKEVVYNLQKSVYNRGYYYNVPIEES